MPCKIYKKLHKQYINHNKDLASQPTKLICAIKIAKEFIDFRCSLDVVPTVQLPSTVGGISMCAGGVANNIYEYFNDALTR